jgi:hypothetical protein
MLFALLVLGPCDIVAVLYVAWLVLAIHDRLRRSDVQRDHGQ